MTSGHPTSNYARCRMPPGRRPRPHERTAEPEQFRDRRRRASSYEVLNPSDFQLQRFAAVKNLMIAFQLLKQEGGQAPGVDGFDFHSFSSREAWGVLRTVSNGIQAGNYIPDPVRIVEFPKPNGAMRRLSLQTLPDRTVAKALLLCLNRFFRSHLPRYAQNPVRIYAQMQRTIRERQSFFIAPDDIQNCFPNTQIALVLACLRLHITEPTLLWLIESIIRGHEGPRHLIGLDQGSPFSPVAMECVLHHCLDVLLDAAHQGFTLFRYVDNLTFLCNSVREGEEALRISREILAESGFRLKGEDGAPQDLRDPECNKRVLALIPKWRSGQLEFSIPEKSFEDLHQGLQDCTDHPRPSNATRWVTNGWTNAVGPALTNTVAPIVVDRIMDITRRIGIREVSRKELLRTARNARTRWLELARSFR